MAEDYSNQERRQYIRLDSVFPVNFKLYSLDEKNSLSEWVQGFTNNIGKGGICLRANNLGPELAKFIRNKETVIAIEMEIPLSRRSISAKAKVAWIDDSEAAANRYLIGLTYCDIQIPEKNRLMRYVWFKRILLPFVYAVILILVLAIGTNRYMNIKLVKGNKALVDQLVNTLQDDTIAKQRIKEISRDKEDLELKMQTLESRMKTAEDENSTQKTKELAGLVDKLAKEKNSLQEQLIALENKEGRATVELLHLNEQKSNLTEANFNLMYKWLSVHQNPRTGLVLSFEGDADIDGWAFTYDQSLAIQAYTLFSDFEKAKRVIDFFDKNAKMQDGLFLNAYYTNDGSPAEYAVHSGPNIWLGVAVAQYIKKTQDTGYLGLAEDIAQKIIHLQNQGEKGGIPGGPNLTWYSTEHNLDAYAFFNMLSEITKKEIYSQARDRVLDWLVLHTYDKFNTPVIRGKGDSTIATDTYAWSIAAVGPEKLAELGMDPDKIIEFAEENCAVEVTCIRPGGQSINVKGFDFSSQKNLARQGVISSEWTAQMILSFRIMADYYNKKGISTKASQYEQKADEYLAQLCNMIISSPSASGQGEGCLPYASSDFVDTGHGWKTPKGKSTGSVAATAYTLFAYYRYNPLKFK